MLAHLCQPDILQINSLCLAPELRGRGLGRAFVVAVIHSWRRADWIYCCARYEAEDTVLRQLVEHYVVGQAPHLVSHSKLRTARKEVPVTQAH